jgi:hypothetical protein
MKTEMMVPTVRGLVPRALPDEDEHGKERRKSVRFALAVPVRIRILESDNAIETRVISGHTMNISTGGALLKTDCAIPAGTRIRMELMFSSLCYLGGADNSAMSVVAIGGRVVRCWSRGIAVAFDSRFSVKTGCGPGWTGGRQV